MADISLSSAVRSNLLTLANTSDLINRTQDRLATGLKVNGPADDAKIFFEAKALNDRASTLNEKKDGIDQAVSSVSVALEAVNAVDSIVDQLKGIAISAQSASTAAEFTELNSQYNSLVTQINNVTSDASYQGLNLVNATGSTLTVSFSESTSSQLTVASVDLTNGSLGLNITTGATLSATSLNTCAINQLDAAVATLSSKAKTLGCRHDRRRCQPGGVADAPAARYLGPVLRGPGRTVGSVAAPLSRNLDNRYPEKGEPRLPLFF